MNDLRVDDGNMPFVAHKLFPIQIDVCWQMVAVATLVFVANVGAENLFAGVAFVGYEHEVRIVNVGVVLCCVKYAGCVEQCARDYHLIEDSPLSVVLVSAQLLDFL